MNYQNIKLLPKEEKSSISETSTMFELPKVIGHFKSLCFEGIVSHWGHGHFEADRIFSLIQHTYLVKLKMQYKKVFV